MQIIYNGEPREVAEEMTIAELLAELDRPARQVAVELNRELISRDQHVHVRLRPGDEVEVVTLAGGG
ncbi:MAG: sulfur carrier protein ThiS [Planctomycetes bacterium]|nr:sulfur carrier protein ThiS [Planctomycetota bacterium]